MRHTYFHTDLPLPVGRGGVSPDRASYVRLRVSTAQGNDDSRRIGREGP